MRHLESMPVLEGSFAASGSGCLPKARERRPSWHSWALCLTGIAPACLLGCSLPNQPTGTIEKKYYAPGPSTVIFEAGTTAPATCCDSKGNPFDIFYPSDFSTRGAPHAIVTWGNGTSFGPRQPLSRSVDAYLRHLASWGFFVVATQDGMTGQGQTIFDAAQFLAAANATGSPNFGGRFVGMLDPNHIGAVGHSQGAGGAIRAMMLSAGKIQTVVPIELPAQMWCFCLPADVLDTSAITQGSIFFIDGSLDIPVSPPTQSSPPSAVGLQSIAAFYGAVPGSVPKLKATLIGPTHNDITGQPGCDTARAEPCFNGVYGYLGYSTAWLADRLGLDASAHAAFINGTGEIFSQTRNWEFVDSNIP